jgi:L-cysteine:1D-myo-inositol 2-amino-2-deoxy-alpha-D-glucopyranoside ligase
MRPWPDVYLPELSSRYLLPNLALMNSSSRQIEELPSQSVYRIYVCGITPYDATHLGHAATYLTFDLINRYLRLTGASVRYVQNITDIDDPLLERANRDGVDWRLLAQSQIDLFKADMTALHVIPPDHYIGVVEAMPLIIDSVQSLIESNTTYRIDSDIYYRVHSDTNFGSISHLSDDQMVEIFAERGGDPLREGKSNRLDALLWLAEREGEPSWSSPFGQGRPGWHIECSAIALAYLSPEEGSDYSIDIQGGGKDLIFPHHEMSAAQSRSINGRPFARSYVHAGMIGLNGQKMSKSLGNLVFVSHLIAQGVQPAAIRWALLQHHYSHDLMWSDAIINDAIVDIDRLKSALSRTEVAPTDLVIENIVKSLASNLDTPSVVRHIRSWMQQTEEGKTQGNAGELSRALDSLLGIAL